MFADPECYEIEDLEAALAAGLTWLCAQLLHRRKRRDVLTSSGCGSQS